MRQVWMANVFPMLLPNAETAFNARALAPCAHKVTFHSRDERFSGLSATRWVLNLDPRMCRDYGESGRNMGRKRLTAIPNALINVLEEKDEDSFVLSTRRCMRSLVRSKIQEG